MDFFGTTMRDSIVGTVDADVIDVSQGNRDTVDGGDGDDTILFGTELNDNDQVDGGIGYDVVNLDGNYFGGVTFTPTSMVNVEELFFEGGNSYTLTMDEATAAGVTFFYVTAGLLDAGDSLYIDFQAETDVIYDISDGRGNDIFIGGPRGANFRLNFGDDTVAGGSGADDFFMGAGLSPGDVLFGGLGTDDLSLGGDYSAGLVITGTMVSDFETLQITPSADVNLTLLDDVYAGFLPFRVRVPSFGSSPGHSIIVDASDEADSSYNFEGGISDETFLGGALGDTFDFATTNGGGQGGVDSVEGNGGDDVIEFDATFTRDDAIDGGAGFDEILLTGDYSAGVNFASTTMRDVEAITLAAGFSYELTVGNNNVQADGFTVDAEALLSGQTLTYDGGAESLSDVVLRGGAGGDTLIAGGGDDELVAHEGADSLVGGDGDDTINGAIGRDTISGGEGTDRLRGGTSPTTFIFTGVSESTGAGRDWLDVIKPLKDIFDLDVAVTGVDARVNAGTLSEGTFDANLAAAIGAGQLAAGHAVVYHPNAGDLSGGFFLVVDANGIAGYQAGLDYVMEFAAGSHPNNIAVGMFV